MGDALNARPGPKTQDPEQMRAARRTVGPFMVALALSPVLPLVAGTALHIPMIVVMVAALLVGWVLFVKFLRVRRKNRVGTSGPGPQAG